MMQMLLKLPQPVIAQVHGIATAAGCQLVAACDLAIAETGAQFATPGVKIGLFLFHPLGSPGPGCGATKGFGNALNGSFYFGRRSGTVRTHK